MTIDRTTDDWTLVARQQAAVGRLGQRGLEAVSLDHLLAEAAELVAVNLGVQSVALYETTPAATSLRIRAAMHEGSWVPRHLLEDVLVPAGSASHVGYTLSVGTAVVAPDYDTDDRFSQPEVGRQAGIRSGVTAMIGWDAEAWGVLGAHSASTRPYSDDDVHFLESVASVLALAIQRRRMEDELRDSSARLDLSLAAGGLGSWQWDLTSERVTFSASLETLLALPEGSFSDRPASDVVALIHEDDREQFLVTVLGSARAGEEHRGAYRVARPDGEIRWIETRGRVLVENDGTVGRVVGVAADITERRLVDEITTSLLEREHEARLQAEQARERLSFLATASASLGSSLDPTVIYRRLADLVVPQLCDVCLVDTFDDDGILSEATVAHTRPEHLDLVNRMRNRRLEVGGDGIWSVRRAVRTAQSELITEITDARLEEAASDASHLELLRTLAPWSVMVVPLIARGRVLGGLTLLSLADGRRFDSDDLTLVEDLVGRAAMAVDNARLFESRGLVSRTLQATLLPPALPDLPWMELAARYRVAEGGIEIGGDFYDVFEVGEGRWALVIGDVCGRGPEAAALTGLMRHSVRAAAVRDDRPSRVLSQTNDAILDQIDDTRFCTAAFVRVVPPPRKGAAAQVTVSCGGHPCPIIVRPDGSVERVEATGTLLGVLPSPSLRDITVDLQPGSSLVLFTDGVTEARRGTEQFGERRLLSLLEGRHDLDAAALGAVIEDTVNSFQDEANDDVAVMVLRIEP